MTHKINNICTLTKGLNWGLGLRNYEEAISWMKYWMKYWANEVFKLHWGLRPNLINLINLIYLINLLANHTNIIDLYSLSLISLIPWSS